MKKKLFVFGTVAALACTPVIAEARTEAVKTGAMEDVNFISATNLFSKSSGSGYGLVSMDGTALTGTIYSSSYFWYKDGLLVNAEAGEEVNSTGAFSLEGKTVIPFQYGEIEGLSSRWFLAYVLEEATASNYDYRSTSYNNGDTYYLISSVDIYYVENAVGNKLGTLTRDQFLDAEAYGDYINIEDRSTGEVTCYDSQFNAVATDLDSIYDMTLPYEAIQTFRDNGQVGLQDADGNVIMAPAFQYINSFERGYAIVSTGDKVGVIDEQGNVIVPAEFERIKTGYYLPVDPEFDVTGINSFGYFAVVQDGKLGFVDETGTITCEPKYSSDIMELCGASATYTDMEGNFHILAADGVDTIIEGYDRVYPMSYGSGMYFQVMDAYYNEGIIDWHGEEVIPCQYLSVDLTGDGTMAVVGLDYESYEFYQLNYFSDEAAPAAETETAGTEAAVPAVEAEPAGTEEAAPAAETEPAGTEEAAPAAETEPAGTEEAAPAAEAEAAPASDNSAVLALVDSAITLLNADASTNAASVSTLLQSAAGLLPADAPAVTLLNSAVTLLGTGGTDPSAVLTLLESAKGML